MSELMIAYLVSFGFNLILLIMMLLSNPMPKPRNRYKKKYDMRIKNAVGNEEMKAVDRSDMHIFKRRSYMGLAIYNAVLTLAVFVEILYFTQSIIKLDENILSRIMYLFLLIGYVVIAIVVLYRKSQVFNDTSRFTKRRGVLLNYQKIVIPSPLGYGGSKTYILEIGTLDYSGKPVVCKFNVTVDLYNSISAHRFCNVIFYNGRIANIIDE